jgi:hypothetical protein
MLLGGECEGGDVTHSSPSAMGASLAAGSDSEGEEGGASREREELEDGGEEGATSSESRLGGAGGEEGEVATAGGWRAMG